MRADRWSRVALAVVLAIVAVWAVGGIIRERITKREEAVRYASWMTGGDPDRGEVLIQKNGCGACHQIPGIPGGRGRVGPSLKGIAGRTYIAGKFANTPQNMVNWVQHPQAMDPGVDMPEMGITDAQARDIAAYLYTLQ